MPNKKIVLIGEYCSDITVKCSASRICPEAPVPVAIPLEKTETDGMAGNVYNNLVSLGWPKEDFRFYFNGYDIKKTRYVEASSGQLMLRVDEGDKINPEQRFNLKEFLYDVKTIGWNNVAAIVISDYNKGFISEIDVINIVKRANAYNIPSFLDTKKVLGMWSKGVTFVKINEKEYQNQLISLEKPVTRYCKNLIVTKGGDGISHVNTGVLYPAIKAEVRDVTGAGDSALAGLVVEYIRTGHIEKAIEYANYVGAVAVSKRGTVAVNHLEVDKLIAKKNLKNV